MKVVVEFKRETVAGGTRQWDNANVHMEGEGQWFVVTQYVNDRSVVIDRIVWLRAADVDRVLLVTGYTESAAPATS